MLLSGVDCVEVPAERSGIPQHLAAQFYKLFDAVGPFEDQLSVAMGHDAPPRSGGSVTELSVTECCRGRGADGTILLQRCPNCTVNIAQFQ
jgi:hypothetical protein